MKLNISVKRKETTPEDDENQEQEPVVKTTRLPSHNDVIKLLHKNLLSLGAKGSTPNKFHPTSPIESHLYSQYLKLLHRCAITENSRAVIVRDQDDMGHQYVSALDKDHPIIQDLVEEYLEREKKKKPWYKRIKW